MIPGHYSLDTCELVRNTNLFSVKTDFFVLNQKRQTLPLAGKHIRVPEREQPYWWKPIDVQWQKKRPAIISEQCWITLNGQTRVNTEMDNKQTSKVTQVEAYKKPKSLIGREQSKRGKLRVIHTRKFSGQPVVVCALAVYCIWPIQSLTNVLHAARKRKFIYPNLTFCNWVPVFSGATILIFIL